MSFKIYSREKSRQEFLESPYSRRGCYVNNSLYYLKDKMIHFWLLCTTLQLARFFQVVYGQFSAEQVPGAISSIQFLAHKRNFAVLGILFCKMYGASISTLGQTLFWTKDWIFVLVCNLRKSIDFFYNHNWN